MADYILTLILQLKHFRVLYGFMKSPGLFKDIFLMQMILQLEIGEITDRK